MAGGGEGNSGGKGKFSCRCRCVGGSNGGGVPVVGVCMQRRDMSDGIGAAAAQRSLRAVAESVVVCWLSLEGDMSSDAGALGVQGLSLVVGVSGV